MAKMEAPYYPIIYVRGYAMTRGEIDETTADPFCGFNLGSTVYRAVSDPSRKPRKYVFESPIVRLMSEFGYSDVYEDGRATAWAAAPSSSIATTTTPPACSAPAPRRRSRPSPANWAI
jgi:hypothetical protein